MNTTNIKVAGWAILAVAILAFGLGYLLSYQAPETPLETEAATILANPRNIQPFKLVDNQGRTFTNEQLKGKWSLMFFGFTSCKTICPTIISELSKVKKTLEKEAKGEDVQFMMVSLDERDTQEKVHDYVTAFHPNFIGLLGSSEQIRALSREMGVVYMKVVSDDAEDEEGYDIDHSGTVLLFNPKGQLHALFSMPHDNEEIAMDLAAIRKIA